jgi:thioredoxin-like negative regulator of GroEL
MKQCKLATVALSGAAAMLLVTPIRLARAADEAKEHGPIAWTESLDDAKKTAAREKKIIFVDFWATWCGPCKQMLKTTYQDKAVVERSKRFVPVLVNFDKQPALVKKYHIGQIPVVMFLDARGKVLKRAEYLDPKAMLAAMDQVLKKKR